MRLAVLASGSGTILQAMLDDELPIAVVVVDRPCRATALAEKAGVPAIELVRDSYGPGFDRDAYSRRLVEALAPFAVDAVLMAGFGTILSGPVFEAYADRIVNTHPTLLPSFPGWHAVRAALDYGVKVTGCTVHVATVEVDHGPILAQEAVPVLPGDDEETLHERIKQIERRLYVATVRDILERGSVL